MPQNKIKVTWLFEQTNIIGAGSQKRPARESGWSESWYYNTGNINDAGLTAAIDRWIDLRNAILNNEARIVGYRLHNVDNNQSRSYVRNAPGTGGECDVPQISALFRAYGRGVANSRPVELRGFPDANVVTGEFSADPVMSRSMRAFGIELQNTWQFPGVDRTVPRFPVSTVSSLGVVSVKELPLGIAQGQQVQFYRTVLDATCCGSLGQFEVASVLGKTITLVNYTEGSAHGGTIGLVPAKLYFQVQNDDNGVIFERIVVRKAGRPFDLFSGRSRRKCCK